jgi:hypothetical protein
MADADLKILKIKGFDAPLNEGYDFGFPALNPEVEF